MKITQIKLGNMYYCTKTDYRKTFDFGDSAAGHVLIDSFVIAKMIPLIQLPSENYYIDITTIPDYYINHLNMIERIENGNFILPVIPNQLNASERGLFVADIEPYGDDDYEIKPADLIRIKKEYPIVG